MATPVSATGPGASGLPFSDKLDAIPRGRPIPVALTEAGLDSPTFRASVAYYSDQIEVIERWLEASAKSASKLTHDILALEDSINTHLTKFMPPITVAENMLDQDYTTLAIKHVNDASRDWWQHVIHMMRKMEGSMIEPVRAFIAGELKTFKDARRLLESTQKTFDQTLARYLAQNKTKEPSALREEAFAVHETRKAYLKASMDFCVQAPQMRASLDRLMVRLCSEMVKEVKRSREASVNTDDWAEEMDRIRGWSREMEAAEPAFKRELASIRREIGDSAIQSYKPARELESYSASTVAFLGSRGPVNMQQKNLGKDGASAPAERQGWLYIKTVTGKPTRTNWARRWFYCRDGVFGSLQQSNQGVFQGDEIGVLLCSVKPAITEERRFCFEVKTKISTMVLQAETQQQLSEWLDVFETAKKQAFETSTTKEAIPMRTGSDPAFAVRPPSMPEFSARNIDASIIPMATYDENTLGLPGNEPTLASRASFDVLGAAPPRRSITAAIGRDMDDHGSSRIMSRLDIHRKGNDAPLSATFSQSGGIASLISGIPVPTPTTARGFSGGFSTSTPGYGASEAAISSLAPLTLSQPPLVTHMSRAAVMSAIDHNVSAGASHHLPAFLLANFWGSNAWSSFYADGHLDYQKEEERALALAASEEKQVRAAGPAQGHSHRKTMSAGVIQPTLMSDSESKSAMVEEGFPARYPPELRVQHASFRLLFPSVPVSEKLVLVFRAAWSSTRGSGTDAGDAKLTATGRVFVTPENLHFYGQRMGLLVAFSLSLDLISEITSAPGKECDFLFLHLTGRDTLVASQADVASESERKDKEQEKEKEPAKAGDTGLSRITIKSFLEDLPLLQARLNVLMDNLQAEEPMDVQNIVANFIDMESVNGRQPASPDGSASIDSWEEVEQPPITLSLPPAARAKKQAFEQQQQQQQQQQKKLPSAPPSPGVLRISRKSTGLSSTRTRTNTRLLPHGPSGYEPTDMDKKVCEKHYEIGAKACFHVVFGDRSYIFARLYHDRQVANVYQGPWALADEGRMRRDFAFEADAVDMLGRKRKDKVSDYQTIDVFTDHSTYVVSHVSTSWHLPFSANFRVVTKVVITHEAKSRCKLAVYTRIDWTKSPPPLSKRMVHKQAMDDAVAAAESLGNAATDQVHKLGAHSRTKKAIQAYGHIGHTTQTVLFSGDGGDGDLAVAPLSSKALAAEASAATAANSNNKNAALRPRTLTQMFWDTARSFAESALTSLLMWIFAVVRSIFSILSAHRALLGLLVASALLNVLMTSKEASTWWTERRAARFMQRVGVGPNVAMSRAVRWEDLGVAVNAGEPLWHDSECFASFQAVANASDPDALVDDAGNLTPAPPLLTTRHSQDTQRRIRRTRQRLGAYRHDLLVAMRVVNRIEREMEMAEWETWLADETVRCRHLQRLLEVPPTKTNNATESDDQEEKKEEEDAAKIAQRKTALTLWYTEYCGSCTADARELAEKQGLGMNLGY